MKSARVLISASDCRLRQTRMIDEASEWQRAEETLERRRQEIEDALPGLQAMAEAISARWRKPPDN